MITRKNRLEPTLILQSVNDVTNCKRNEKPLFSVFYKVYAVNPTQIESRDKKKNRGIRDQVLQKFWNQGSKFKA